MQPSQKEKFQVVVRIKPYREQDREQYTTKHMENILKFNSTLVTIRKPLEDKTFNFNKVFYSETQQQVFRSAEHLVNQIFEGYNSTFLAYGQTGTGKTHTVFGSKQAILQSNPDHPEAGIFYRCAGKLFEEIKDKMHSRQFNVRISFLEFYLDNIYDMLSDDPKFNKKAELKQTPKEGIIVKDLTEVSVRSFEQLVNILKKPIRSRKTESTSINRNSSRSHALIQICLRQRWRAVEDGQQQTKQRKGILKIVDLAGSERVSKTQSQGTRLEQAKRINKQITTLGKCIQMLVTAEKQNNRVSDGPDRFNFKVHVPFRDTKLTRYLADSLDGRSKIVLCVCISNYIIHSQETFSSLLFASKAMTLKIDPRRNEQSLAKTAATLQQPKSHTPTKLPATNGFLEGEYETPSKNSTTNNLNNFIREQNNSRTPRDLNKSIQKKQSTLSSSSGMDAVAMRRLKQEIMLIDEQVMGNVEELNLESVDRVHLEQAVRTYSMIVLDLQEKLERANQKILQYQSQNNGYSRY